MIVKRISYFTFMVAITTIATVGSCSKVKANPSATYSGNAVEKAHSLLFEGTVDDLYATGGDNIALARVLRERGLKSGRFKITTHHNGHENVVSVYLIFDKDYRGHVSVRIFDSKHTEYDKIPVALATTLPPGIYADISFDKREGIAQKNRIQRE